MMEVINLSVQLMICIGRNSSFTMYQQQKNNYNNQKENKKTIKKNVKAKLRLLNMNKVKRIKIPLIFSRPY